MTMLVRGALAVLAVVGLQIGVWASLFPAQWFRSFPGAGRTWVASDGPYNEHLVRDVGAAFLALGVLAGWAALRQQTAVAQVAAVGWLVFSVPHFAYHLGHLDGYEAIDAVGNISSLALTVGLPVLVLAASRRTESVHT